MRLIAPPTTIPPRRSGARLRLVVVEDGARELDSRVPPDEGEESIVVAQASGELPATLALAVTGRIAALERSSRNIERAVVLIGPDCGVQVCAARWLVARALLTHMVVSGSGELVLAAPGAGVDVRQDLLSLVEALLGEHERSAVPIRLQLREDAPRPARTSGIHLVRTLVEPPPGMVGEAFPDVQRDGRGFIVASRRSGR